METIEKILTFFSNLIEFVKFYMKAEDPGKFEELTEEEIGEMTNKEYNIYIMDRALYGKAKERNYVKIAIVNVVFFTFIAIMFLNNLLICCIAALVAAYFVYLTHLKYQMYKDRCAHLKMVKALESMPYVNCTEDDKVKDCQNINQEEN